MTVIQFPSPAVKKAQQDLQDMRANVKNTDVYLKRLVNQVEVLCTTAPRTLSEAQLQQLSFAATNFASTCKVLSDILSSME